MHEVFWSLSMAPVRRCLVSVCGAACLAARVNMCSGIRKGFAKALCFGPLRSHRDFTALVITTCCCDRHECSEVVIELPDHLQCCSPGLVAPAESGLHTGILQGNATDELHDMDHVKAVAQLDVMPTLLVFLQWRQGMQLHHGDRHCLHRRTLAKMSTKHMSAGCRFVCPVLRRASTPECTPVPAAQA